MEEIVSEAMLACPGHNVSAMIEQLYNVTKFADTKRLARFICDYTDTLDLIPKLAPWNGIAYIVGFAFGLPSAVLAIVTFYQKDFDTVSFFYHRMINMIELLYMAFVFESALEFLTGDLRKRSWIWCQYLTYFHYKLDLALPFSIELIIIWVAIERVAICFTNRWFQMINRKRIACTIVIGSLIVSIAMYFPTAFTTNFVFDNTTRKYAGKPTSVSSGYAFEIYTRLLACYAFVRFALMTVATVATIVGLIKISRRKRKLAVSAGYKSPNAQLLLRQINTNSQLCLLQLCESMPILAHSIILIWIQNIFLTLNPAELVSMSYEEATRNLSLARLKFYLALIETWFDVIEHGTHFYRYLIFSKKVQNTVSGMFKKTSVSQASTVATR